MVEFRWSFPLDWPQGRPQTEPHQRVAAAFRATPAQAQGEMLVEIERMGGTQIALSTAMRVTREGRPYQEDARASWLNPAVVVRFNRGVLRPVFSCDRFKSRHHNMRAIGRSIESIRGMERWGVHQAVDMALRGFEALPAPAPTSGAATWWETLGLTPTATAAEVTAAFKRLYRGETDPSRQRALIGARDQARAALGDGS